MLAQTNRQISFSAYQPLQNSIADFRADCGRSFRRRPGIALENRGTLFSARRLEHDSVEQGRLNETRSFKLDDGELGTPTNACCGCAIRLLWLTADGSTT